MLKVASTCEDHRHAMFIGGGDDFGVVAGAAGLNGGEDASFGGLVDAVSEREESVAGDNAPLASISGLLSGDLCRIESAHLACSGSGDRSVLAKDDRIRLHMLENTPSETGIAEFGIGRLTVCDNLPIGFGD